MPKLYRARYTDAEAVAAAKADADIADAITKKHTQNTDNKLQNGGEDVVTTETEGIVNLPKQSRIRAYRTGSEQTIPTGTWTKVGFNAENYDEQEEYDKTTTFRFTAAKAGYYLVHCTIRWKTSVDETLFIVRIKKNGVETSRGFTVASGIHPHLCTITDILQFSAEDYIEIEVNQGSGGDINILDGTNDTYLTVHKLS